MLKNTPQEGATGPGTVVGVNVALTGTLKDQNDISVFGMVDGEVISERSVMVGQTAQVKGPVRGITVTIAGTVRGSIDASEKLEILETGKVFGSIASKDLVVHSGAMISGKIIMSSEEEAAVVDDEVSPDKKTNNKEQPQTKGESEVLEAGTPDNSVQAPQPDEE